MRRRALRHLSLPMDSATRIERARAHALHGVADVARPQKREECRGGCRPCPFVGCAHHLYLDVNPDSGSIVLNFPELEPWEMGESCSLDVAERGSLHLEQVGDLMNLTRERIRQVEIRALLSAGTRKASTK